MLYTNFAIMLGLLYSFLPFMVLPLYASLEKMDFRLVEAGFDLYATRGRVLRRIIIPLAKPGIIAGCLLVFIPAIGAYVTPLILGGGKHLMIGSLIALQFGSSRNWPFGSAQALILMAGRAGRAAVLCAQHDGQGAGCSMADAGRCHRGSDWPAVAADRRQAAAQGSRPEATSRASATIAICCMVMLYAPILVLVGLLLQRQPLGDALGRLQPRLVCRSVRQRRDP